MNENILEQRQRQEQLQQEQLQQEQQLNVLQQQEQQIDAEQQPELQEQQRRNGGLKAQKTPEQLEQEAAREKEKKRQRALKADRQSVRNDKARHGFYTVVKGFVSLFTAGTAQSKARRGVRENTQYMQSLQIAYDEMFARRLAAEQDEADGQEGAIAQFEQTYGEHFARITAEYVELQAELRDRMRREIGEDEINEDEYSRRLAQEMQQKQTLMELGAQQRANVVGGTKPAAVQYGQDGSKWLVKESVSCIGVNAPDAALVTEAGYKVQRLVNPDTAIEAFRGQSVGKGIVSYQRMVSGVVNDVDLFRFSRTPESMTEQELARVQQLSPQLLREHTTDWLLCNFDTKGENFVIARDGAVHERVYGIDKEAAFRPILDEGAQKMSKDYRRFDQETVYNRLFQKFSDGSMDIELFDVQAQIERVEAMSDEEYINIFDDYLRRQRVENPDKVDQIRENILKRKQNLRMEYREFFTRLVNERCEKLPEQANALKQKYFGSTDGGIFRFQNEGIEVWEQEREKKRLEREANREELDRKAREADEADEKSYKRRHGFYDFSKAVVMGTIAAKRQRAQGEQQTTSRVFLSEVITNQQNLERLGDSNAAFMERFNNAVAALRHEADAQIRQQLGLAEGEMMNMDQLAMVEAIVTERMKTETIEINMERMHEVHLGGTKPMSEFFAEDGSRWLSKQAVNCMGYYKKEGVVLTEAGAKLQKIVHPETAVDAFVGRTRQLGDVSFQRRLENVEGGENKLDLFKFSKHPEIATAETIAQVQAIGGQILREHTTDWLLCNFDTKGENFVITIENGQRVLHGIDKEAAFSKVLKPEAQVMSTTYKPHANNTLYNVVFSMFEKGEMDLNLFDTLPQIEKIEAMGDEEYLQTFENYFDYLAEKSPETVEGVRAAILGRKQNLRQDYSDFFTKLVLNRCKTLHPDEAQALKARYFGAGGQRFTFPGGGE